MQTYSYMSLRRRSRGLKLRENINQCGYGWETYRGKHSASSSGMCLRRWSRRLKVISVFVDEQMNKAQAHELVDMNRSPRRLSRTMEEVDHW